VRNPGRSSFPWEHFVGNKALRFELTQIATELTHDRETISPASWVEMLGGSHIAFDHLGSRPLALKAFLVQKTVEKPQQSDLSFGIDAA
jgi:hypothetical protein